MNLLMNKLLFICTIAMILLYKYRLSGGIIATPWYRIVLNCPPPAGLKRGLGRVAPA